MEYAILILLRQTSMTNLIRIIRKNKFKAKWIVGITLIAIIPSFLLSLFVIHTISNERIQDLQKLSKNISNLLQGFLIEDFVYNDYRGIIQKVNYLYRDQSLGYIRVYDRDRGIIYAIPTSTKKSIENGCLNNSLYIKSKSGNILGSIAFGIKTSAANQEKKFYLFLLLFCSFISTSLMILALYFAIRSLLIPYGEIIKHLSKTAKGSCDPFDKYADTKDERKNISKHINKLISDISSYQKELVDISTYKAITNTTQTIAHDLTPPISVINQTMNAKSWTDFIQRKQVTTSAMLRLQCMVDSFKKAELESIIRTNWGEIQWDTIVNEMRSIAEEKGILVHIKNVYRGPLYLDIPKIERVIINLLKNSIESKCKNIWLSTKTENGSITIIVSDDGPGVPKEFIANLFIKGETFNKSGGSGIGLSFAKQTANGHGGDIIYERQNNLSNFSITLPSSIPKKEYPAISKQKTISLNSKKPHSDSTKSRNSLYKITIKITKKKLESKITDELQKNYPNITFSGELDGSSFIFTDCYDLVPKALASKIPLHMLNDKKSPEFLIKTISNKIGLFTANQKTFATHS